MKIESSFYISASFLFMLMAWISMSLARNDNEIYEFPVYLRIQSIKKYYAGKIFVLLLLSLCVTVFFITFIIVENIINDQKLFIRRLNINDVVNAFLFILGGAICGCSTGSFFHPIYIKDRRWTVVLTILLCVIIFAKSSIIMRYPISRFVLWIIPSATLAAEFYENQTGFKRC